MYDPSRVYLRGAREGFCPAPHRVGLSPLGIYIFLVVFGSMIFFQAIVR